MTDFTKNQEAPEKEIARITFYTSGIIVDTNRDASIGESPGKRLGKRIRPDVLKSVISKAAIGTGLLPRGTLAYTTKRGHDYVVLWKPPHVATLQTETHTYHVPLPGLIFSGWQRVYCMYAVATNSADYWPQKDDRLYWPPLTNIQSQNTVCTGANKFPKASKDTIEDVWGGIFGSIFTAHVVNNRAANFTDIRALWNIIDGKPKFPLDELVETKLTVGDITNG